MVPLWPFQKITGGFIDLQVYRLGIEALRDGADMYGQLPQTTIGIGLPFIYPPFAAVVLSPFALLPWDAAAFTFFITSTVALALTLYLVARRRWPEQSGSRLALLAASCATPLAMLLEPIRSTLDFGQVNLLLMALVAADCLAEKPKWRRGMLIGIAAAIKLTPAAFVLYFLVRRDYKAAATAAITGAGATALSFAVLPHESVQYWFGGLGNVSGLSGSSFHTNQSIQAVLARFGIEKPLFTLLWLLLSGRRRYAAGGRRARVGVGDQRGLHAAGVADLLVASLGVGRARAARDDRLRHAPAAAAGNRLVCGDHRLCGGFRIRATELDARRQTARIVVDAMAASGRQHLRLAQRATCRAVRRHDQAHEIGPEGSCPCRRFDTGTRSPHGTSPDRLIQRARTTGRSRIRIPGGQHTQIVTRGYHGRGCPAARTWRARSRIQG
jgi:hypothetical protein